MVKPVAVRAPAAIFIASWPANSQLGAGHERGYGPVDSVDDHWVRGIAGADRRPGLLPAFAHAGGVARAARLCDGADAGGWTPTRSTLCSRQPGSDSATGPARSLVREYSQVA